MIREATERYRISRVGGGPHDQYANCAYYTRSDPDRGHMAISPEELLDQVLGEGSVVEVTVRLITKRRPVENEMWLDEQRRRKNGERRERRRVIGKQCYWLRFKPRRVYAGKIVNVRYLVTPEDLDDVIGDGACWGGIVYYVKTRRGIVKVGCGTAHVGRLPSWIPPGDDGTVIR